MSPPPTPNAQVDLLLRLPKSTERFSEVKLTFGASTLAITQDHGKHFLFVRIFDKLRGSLPKSGPLDFATKNTFPLFFVGEEALVGVY